MCDLNNFAFKAMFEEAGCWSPWGHIFTVAQQIPNQKSFHILDFFVRC
jgi:hypothetical protein